MDIILVGDFKGRSAVVERIINGCKKNDRRARVDSRQPMCMCLVAGAGRIPEFDISDTRKTDLIKSPQRVGVVPYVPSAFGDIRIFKDRFKSLANV